jgi:mono/diheme cytochrome c family protein
MERIKLRLKVILALTTLALSGSGCGLVKGLFGKHLEPVSASLEHFSDVSAYQQTLFPVARSSCSGCHASTQSPFFAAADLNASYAAVLPLVNFTDVPSSTLAVHAQNAHCGQSVCTGNQAPFIKAIQQWLNLRNNPPPEALAGFSYSGNPLSATQGAAITPLAPSFSAGIATSFSSSPALPAGLSLDAGSGVVSGTPTATSPAANYVITATNSVSSATFSLNITVSSPSGPSPAEISVFSTGFHAFAATNCVNCHGSSQSPLFAIADVNAAYANALPFLNVDNPGSSIIVSYITDQGSVCPCGVGGACSSSQISQASADLSAWANVITGERVTLSGFSYPSGSLIATVGTAISNQAPSFSAGVASSFAAAPALPAGLSLDVGTGVISGAPTSPFAKANYTITATNPQGSATFTLSIQVNDIPPSGLSYAVSPLVATKGTAITADSASFTGGASTTFSVSPALPAGLTLSPTGGAISGTPTAISSATSYHISASNSGGSTAVDLTIQVNDVAPSGLAYSVNPLTATLGSAITADTATHGGGAPTSFSVSPALPAGLSLDAGSGAISGTPTSVSGSAGYTVTASNSGGSATATVTITVNDTPPSHLSYSVNPLTATAGTAISPDPASFTGGTTTTFSVSPSLPSGLSLDPSSGKISGAPASAQSTTNYTITASNSGGSTQVVLPITVNSGGSSLLTYATNPLTITKGVAMASDTPSLSGGAVATSYNVSPALPSGLNLNTSSGVVSGTPTAVGGIASYTVTAQTNKGPQSVTLNITVNDAAPSSLAYATNPLTATLGVAIAADSPSSSGGAVVSYSVSPALPAGLSLNTSTGIVSGTPSAIQAQTPYTITATNTGGSTNVVLKITVNDAPPTSLAYATNPVVATRGSAIPNDSPSNSGGTVVSYSVSPALPSGFSLNTSTGVVSGTPTAIQTRTSYTVTATNSGGSSTVALLIQVNDIPPSSLTYTNMSPTYTVGAPIPTNSPTSSGGPVVSYSVSPDLPSGISIDSVSGLITGTPTAVGGPSNYQVTATNTGGSTTATLSITMQATSPPVVATPTTTAVLLRALNILGPAGVSLTSRNTAQALKIVGSSLPSTTDPLSASGQSAIPVLVYAMCSDVSAAQAKSYFGVDTTQSVSSQSANLAAAGAQMVNSYVGGLAANGTMNGTIQNLYNQTLATFSSLVTANSSAGTAEEFTLVCTSANVFGIEMLGF